MRRLPCTEFDLDPVNNSRLSLDNSIALLHIKFNDPETRQVLLPLAPQTRTTRAPRHTLRSARLALLCSLALAS